MSARTGAVKRPARYRRTLTGETALPAVTIYTKPGCPYCMRALRLLDEKGVDYEEVVASNNPEKKQEMIQRSGGRMTFPQIFIGDRHIGGCDDMMDLEDSGELDRLLEAA